MTINHAAWIEYEKWEKFEYVRWSRHYSSPTGRGAWGGPKISRSDSLAFLSDGAHACRDGKATVSGAEESKEIE